MRIKEFIKPNRNNIIIGIILFVLLIVFSAPYVTYWECECIEGSACPPCPIYVSFLFFDFNLASLGILSISLVYLIMYFIYIIISYLLACVLSLAIKKKIQRKK